MVQLTLLRPCFFAEALVYDRNRKPVYLLPIYYSFFALASAGLCLERVFMDLNYRRVYLKYLALLAELIGKLDRQARGDAQFLQARLCADMLPLHVQAKVAVSFAMRACMPQSPDFTPDPEAGTDTPLGLILYIRQAIDLITDSILIAPDEIQDKAGFSDIRMSAPEFVAEFALPNFFFHLSMVYAIAKKHGFELTKADFDGIHQYPAGFSWEAQ